VPTVTAAVARGPCAGLEIEELEMESPRPDEVLVRVGATGVCHTDVIARDQWFPVPVPVVLGHEGAGVVEAVGSCVRRVAPGDRVVLSFDSCGACEPCMRARPTYCLEAFERSFSAERRDGTTALRRGSEKVHSHFFGQSSFATYALAMERSVVKVDTDVPLELLGPLGCGVQTGAGAVLNALQCVQGTSLAVFGTGAVGLSAVMASQIAGCTTVVAIDLNERRRELALALGATHAVDPNDGDVVQAIIDASKGGVSYALDTTGIPDVVRACIESLGPLGVCGIVGSPRVDAELRVQMHRIFFGRTVRGIIEGDSAPERFIPEMIRLHEAGRFPFDRLIAFYDLENINEALEDAESGAVVKPVIRMSGAMGKTT
jgi:aryl-alcohol dehydrogenase